MKKALGLGAAVAAWLKSFFANPCGSLRWQSAKLEENIERRDQNLRPRLTNISQQNSQKYFKKPNQGIPLEPNQNTG